jgi:hypothetical protein
MSGGRRGGVEMHTDGPAGRYSPVFAADLIQRSLAPQDRAAQSPAI